MKLTSQLKAAFWVTAFVGALLFLGYHALGWYWRPFAVVNAMKTLSRGLDDYYDKHGSYPPDLIDGQPDHSWRVRVLPEIYPPEEQTASSRTLAKYTFEKNWDDPTNRRVADELLGSPAGILAIKLPNGEWLASEYAVAVRVRRPIPAPALLAYWIAPSCASNQPGDLVWDGESDSITLGSRSFPLTEFRGRRLIRANGDFDVVPENCDLQTVKAILREQQW